MVSIDLRLAMASIGCRGFAAKVGGTESKESTDGEREKEAKARAGRRAGHLEINGRRRQRPADTAGGGLCVPRWRVRLPGDGSATVAVPGEQGQLARQPRRRRGRPRPRPSAPVPY